MMLTLLLSAMFVGTALAHSTDDEADDTPNMARFNDNPVEPALAHYGGAVANSGGAALNSTVRNPTCGAHAGGIHPPGNP